MSTPTIEDQIQAHIETFAAELSDLVRQAALVAVQGALTGTSTGAASTTRRKNKKKAGRPKGSRNVARKTTRKKRVRRSAEDIEKLSGLIRGYVKESKGSRLEEISKGLGIASAEMKGPIKDMLLAGKLRKTGAKRGTTYFVKGK